MGLISVVDLGADAGIGIVVALIVVGVWVDVGAEVDVGVSVSVGDGPIPEVLFVAGLHRSVFFVCFLRFWRIPPTFGSQVG